MNKIFLISITSLMLVAASSWFYGLRPGQELYYHWRGTYTDAWRGVRYMSNYGGTWQCELHRLEWVGSFLRLHAARTDKRGVCLQAAGGVL